MLLTQNSAEVRCCSHKTVQKYGAAHTKQYRSTVLIPQNSAEVRCCSHKTVQKYGAAHTKQCRSTVLIPQNSAEVRCCSHKTVQKYGAAHTKQCRSTVLIPQNSAEVRCCSHKTVQKYGADPTKQCRSTVLLTQNSTEVRCCSHKTVQKYGAAHTECWLVGCLKFQQHASVSQGRICSDNFTCCHTEIEVADQTFHLTQSQYTDAGPTSPSTDPITPGAWQGSHWSANFLVTGMTRPRKKKKKPGASGIRTPDLPLSRRTP